MRIGGELLDHLRISRSGLNVAAFEQLFDRNFGAIYGYLARRVGPDIARDLAAETFAQAFANRRRYDHRRGDARSWLYGIAHNLLGRHYRDEERRLRALARLEAPHEQAPPEEPLVANVLAELTPEERDVLLLYAWADLSYDEVAAVLSVPVGTIRSRLHRARIRFREALTREEAGWMSSRR